MEALYYFIILRKIVSKYILVKNFSEKILIEQISKDYCKRIYSEEDYFVYGIPYDKHKESGYWCGIEDFIDYKKTLLTEKNIFGFKNLAIAYEIEKKRL